ncbi:MAG: glycosyltransferase family 4 protein [Bacteroidia bacterium]
MRIAFDAKRYFKNPTGLGNYARWLIQGLNEEPRDLDVQLYAGNHAEGAYGPTRPLSRAFPSIWRTKWIIKDLLKNQVEIFHGLSNEIPFGMHKTKIKSVVTIHDLIQKRYPENYSWIDRNIYNAKIRYAQKHSDCIVVPSEQTKRDLIKYFNTDEQKIAVIPLGFDTQIQSPTAEAKETYVLCVSGFNRRKNLVRMLKAFDQSNLDCKLIIAGKSGDSLIRMKTLSKKMPNVELVVDPSTKEIQELYSTALFCIYPSLFEGFGIPLIEAMQYGKIVASSKSSSLPEVGGEAAYYFNPEDIDSIKSAMENLYHSPSLRQHHESLIKEQLNKFEHTAIIEKYHLLYKALV